MKKGMRLVLVTALFAAIMSGCGKKEKAVTDDFKDVQGTTATASETDVDTEAVDEEFDPEDMFGEYEIVDLPVDATVTYGDKKADLHFDLQDWPTDISGPINASVKPVDQAYIEKLANAIFDDGKYEIVTPGSTPGELLTESSYSQGTEVDTFVSCDLIGKVDGVEMDMYFSEQTSGTAMSPRNLTLLSTGEDVGLSWMEMADWEVEEAGGNSYNKNEALEKANNYLRKWGFEDYECVSCTDVADYSMENAKPAGYNFTFRKKIGTSLGEAYEANCFYDSKDPHPTYFEQILMVITEKGPECIDICDIYEVGTEKQEATLMGKDEAVEKGTKAIEEYLEKEAEDSYIVWAYENKSVWNVKVELSYVPIASEDGIAYRALYIFALEDDGYYKDTPIAAIDAETGEAYEVNYMYFPEGESGAKG